MISSCYLHVPFCLHLCNYCDFYKKKHETSSFKDFESFLDKTFALSLSQHEEQLGPLKTLYFGGGTPSLWSPDYTEKVLLKKLSLHSTYEWTLEIDPYKLDLNNVQKWIQLGVNRLSFGVQSLNDAVLEKLDRQHRREDLLPIFSFLKEKNMNYSIDLLLGAPSVQRNLIQEIQEMLSYKPSHLSLYFLTVGKNYVHFHELPSDELIREEFLSIQELLEKESFIHYEVSNYGKIPSQHNQIYWSQKSCLALGPSASGYCSIKKTRYKITPSGSVQLDPLSLDQVLLEEFYLNLRQFKVRTDLLEKSSNKTLDQLRESNLIHQDQVTKEGILLLDFIANELTPHLRPTEKTEGFC